MRPFGEHFGHDFAKIDVIFSRFGACGAQVAHRSLADVVSDTLSRIHSPQFTLVLIEKVALSLERRTHAHVFTLFIATSCMTLQIEQQLIQKWFHKYTSKLCSKVF